MAPHRSRELQAGGRAGASMAVRQHAPSITQHASISLATIQSSHINCLHSEVRFVEHTPRCRCRFYFSRGRCALRHVQQKHTRWRTSQ